MTSKFRHIIFLLPDIKGGGAEKSTINLYLSMKQYSEYPCHLIALGNIVEYDIDENDYTLLNVKNQFSKKGLARFTYRKKMAEYIDQYITDNFGKDSVIFSNMILCDKIMSQSQLSVYHIIRNSYSSALLTGKSFLKQLLIKRNISNVYSKHPLLFVSEGAKQSFELNFRSPQKKQVVYNIVQRGDIEKRSCALIPKQQDYILHIGRYNRQKRHDRLLDIFTLVNSPIQLKIMGQGELKTKIVDKIKHLGLTDKVHLQAFDPNPYPYIKQAKVVVLTSDFEGLPRVLMESVALQKPIVAFDCPGGVNEVITNQNSLIEMGDNKKFAASIEDALVNPDKYTSKLKVEFTPEYVCKQLSALVS